MAIRNVKKGIKAIEQIKLIDPKANVIVKLLDLSLFESIRSFADDVKNDFEKIDILINNAATISKNFEMTSDGNELTMVTNYLGNVKYSLVRCFKYHL